MTWSSMSISVSPLRNFVLQANANCAWGPRNGLCIGWWRHEVSRQIEGVKKERMDACSELFLLKFPYLGKMEEKRRDKQQHKKNQSNDNHTAKLWNIQKMSSPALNNWSYLFLTLSGSF